jgi:uncharacterized membrane protein YhaH (DUF805 family)
MNLVRLYTSFVGRISRKHYWLGALLLFAVGIALLAILFFSGVIWLLVLEAPTLAVTLASLAVFLVFLYFGTALMVKRLHDRNRPTYWAAFILVPLLAKVVTDLAGITGKPLDLNPIDYGFLIVLVVIVIWFFVELGCLRGTVGPNRYGPDPLDRASAR